MNKTRADRKKLKARLLEAGYTVTGWARAHGYTRHDMNNVFREEPSFSQTSQDIVRKLKEEFGE